MWSGNSHLMWSGDLRGKNNYSFHCLSPIRSKYILLYIVFLLDDFVNNLVQQYVFIKKINIHVSFVFQP